MTKNKKPLKITFVYDDSLDGSEGVANQVKLLGDWLTRRGHSVSYMVGQTKLSSWAGGRVYSLAKNIKVVFNGNRLTIPLPAGSKNIKRALAAVKQDVLHVQMPHSPFLAQRVINRADAPAVGTFHIFPANRLAIYGSKILKLFYFKGLGRLDPIASVSPAAQAFAQQSFGINSQLIPNSVDLAQLKSDKSPVPDTIVFLGRLVERKGCRQLINAFSLVKPSLPGAKLIIGGTGPEESSLRALARQLNLTDDVEFRGFINETDKADFLAQATVACFPSLYGESFGIVLIEAMAAGAQVVVGGNNPGYASVMKDFPELLFDPRNTEKLAELLLELLSDEHRQKKIHVRQQKFVKHFDINVIGAAYEGLYVRAIAKKRLSRHN